MCKKLINIGLIISLILGLGFGVQSCSSEDDEFSENQISHDDIYELADKYGVSIESIGNQPQGVSLKDIETLFESISTNRKDSTVIELKFKGEEGVNHAFTEIEEISLSPYLKNSSENQGSNSVSLSKWDGNFIWVNVDLSWKKEDQFISNVSLSSYLTGYTLVSYEHIYSSYSINGDYISFTFKGRGYFKFIEAYVTVEEHVTGTGYVDTNSKTGFLSLSYN